MKIYRILNSKFKYIKSLEFNSNVGVTKDRVPEFYELDFIALLLTNNDLAIKSAKFEMLCRAKPSLNTNTALTSLERPLISQSWTENELSPDHKESSWYTFTFSSWLRQNHGNSVLICNFLAAMSALLNIIPGLTGPNRGELRLLTVIMSALIISNKLWLIPQRQPLVWLIEYHEMFTAISALAVVVMIPTADTDLAELL